MTDLFRTANLLGAASLAVTDSILDNVTSAAGVSASGAAALVTLSADPRVSVTELGRRIGLSQSAAARMVDSLESDGLVERRPNPFNPQWATIHLTRAGRRARQKLLAARSDPVADAVAALGEDDQQMLAELLATLLTRLYERVGQAQYICRLCDRAACTAGATCPVAEAEGQQPSPAEQDEENK